MTTGKMAAEVLLPSTPVAYDEQNIDSRVTKPESKNVISIVSIEEHRNSYTVRILVHKDDPLNRYCSKILFI